LLEPSSVSIGGTSTARAQKGHPAFPPPGDGSVVRSVQDIIDNASRPDKHPRGAGPAYADTEVAIQAINTVKMDH